MSDLRHRSQSVSDLELSSLRTVLEGRGASDGAASPLDLSSLLLNPESLKRACRLGLPFKQRREVWKAIIELRTQKMSSDYLAAKLDVFGGVSPFPTRLAHTPSFGSGLSWSSSLASHVPPKRALQAQSVLCVLACSRAALAHAPCLPDLACLFLLFFDEATAHALLERVVVRSREDEYFVTTQPEAFASWTRVFARLLADRLPNLDKHMRSEKVRVDASKVFAAWLARLFVGYLPLACVIRLVDALLCEGHKVLFRVGLAIFKVHATTLLACQTRRDFLARLHEVMAVQDADTLLREAFDLYLSRNGHLAKIRRRLVKTDANGANDGTTGSRGNAFFHLPRFCRPHGHESSLVDIEQLFSLWSWLPPRAAICDPLLLYATNLHGYSSATLIARACDTAIGTGEPIFLLVRLAGGRVVGLFLPKPFLDPTVRRAAITPAPLVTEAFLFELHPTTRVWRHRAMRARDTRPVDGEDVVGLDSATNASSSVTNLTVDVAPTPAVSVFRPYGLDLTPVDYSPRSERESSTTSDISVSTRAVLPVTEPAAAIEPATTRTDTATSAATDVIDEDDDDAEQKKARADAMLLMADHGFGIVDSGGAVFFLSADLKTLASGPSAVFGSPSLTGSGGVGASSAASHAPATVTEVEVWTFAAPSSNAFADRTPRPANQPTTKAMPYDDE